MSEDSHSSRSQSQRGKSQFYSQSAFLRTSAVYGSGEPTPFNETTTEKFRRTRGLSADDEMYHRSAGQPTMNSISRQRSNTPTDGSANRIPLASRGSTVGIRGSLLHTAPSPSGGYYETSNGQYGSAHNTPERSRVAGNSPMRSRQAPVSATPQREASSAIQRGPNLGTPVSAQSGHNGSVARRASGISSGGASSVIASPTVNTMWSRESVASSGAGQPTVSRTNSPNSQRRDVPLEAPAKNTIARNQSASSRLFGGGETYDLITGRANSPNASRTASGSETPLRVARRMVAPPERKEPDGLWVRTKGKNDALILGSRRHCAEPPSSKEMVPVVRHILSRPDSLQGPCRVIAEETPSRSGSRVASPRGGSPYRGVVPPFKVDPELMTTRLDGSLAGGERETFMEPFGTEYTHRRHYDPKDSVKEDIQHLNIAPTQNPPASGVARVAAHQKDVNIFALQKYTPEELHENTKVRRHMVGPPAFVFDPPRKRLESPRRHSPNLQSSLTFGTSAGVALGTSGMNTPASGGGTPRRRASGAYTPQRSDRPF